MTAQCLLFGTDPEEALGVSMEWLLTGADGKLPAPPAAAEGPSFRQNKAEVERLAKAMGEAESSISRLREFLG